jgi:hypothetical protein
MQNVQRVTLTLAQAKSQVSDIWPHLALLRWNIPEEVKEIFGERGIVREHDNIDLVEMFSERPYAILSEDGDMCSYWFKNERDAVYARMRWG